MSITHPPVESRQSGQSSDDVDGVLRDFFQSALPKPWPAPPTRVQNVLPFTHSSSWRRRARSVLALAASLAIMALTLGLLSGKFSDRSPAGFQHDGPGGNRVKPYTDSVPKGEMQPAKE